MKTLRENLFCAAPLVSGNTRNSSTPASASTFKMPSSLCLCVSQSSFSPLFIWIPVFSFGAHPKSRMLSSQDSQLHLQISYFQASLHSVSKNQNLDIPLGEQYSIYYVAPFYSPHLMSSEHLFMSC